MYRLLVILLLASAPAFAAEPVPYPDPVNASLMAVQQQRNEALVRAADAEVALAFARAKAAQVARYWEDYLKGLKREPVASQPK